jgi:hypothetical protein
MRGRGFDKHDMMGFSLISNSQVPTSVYFEELDGNLLSDVT